MNVLVNGTSISRGLGAWPYYLQEKIGPQCNIVNLAQAGSGNTYIHESTIEEISKRSYDLVLVQWTYANRIDFRVSDISKFQDTTYTSEYQTQQNDWPGKIIHPINDQDYVQKNWAFGCGYINEPDRGDSIERLFKGYYEESGASEHMFSSLIKMISLQNTLKQLCIPYVFIEYRAMAQFNRFNNLYDLIDWSHFYSDTYLFNIAEDAGALDDTLHPSAECQQIYANHLYNELIKKGLV